MVADEAPSERGGDAAVWSPTKLLRNEEETECAAPSRVSCLRRRRSSFRTRRRPGLTFLGITILLGSPTKLLQNEEETTTNALTMRLSPSSRRRSSFGTRRRHVDDYDAALFRRCRRR